MIKQYSMKWPIYPCKLTSDNEIVALTLGEPTGYYNPFDYYDLDNSSSLCMKFASLDINYPEDILDFISRFGFLGLNIRDKNKFIEDVLEEICNDYSELNSEYANYIHNAKNAPPLDSETHDNILSKLIVKSYKVTKKRISVFENEITPKESLDDISNEIIKLNKLLNLIQNKETFELEELYQSLSGLSGYTNPRLPPESSTTNTIINIFKENNNLEDMRYYANYTIREIISREMDGVSPVLVPTYPYINTKFDTTWKANTLISAIYTMLYMDLVQGKSIKKCKSVTCNKWFEIYANDDRKIFCNKKCADSHASREYRKRKKTI